MYTRSKHVQWPRSTSCKLQPHVLETCCSMQEICYKIASPSSIRSGCCSVEAHMLAGYGCMVPTSLSGWLSSGQSSGLTGAWPLLATAAASWLSSLVAEQPRPRGTQLRGPAAAGWGSVAASTTMCCACKSSRWTRRTEVAMAVDTLLSAAATVVCAWSWRGDTTAPRVAKAASLGSAHRQL